MDNEIELDLMDDEVWEEFLKTLEKNSQTSNFEHNLLAVKPAIILAGAQNSMTSNFSRVVEASYRPSIGPLVSEISSNFLLERNANKKDTNSWNYSKNVSIKIDELLAYLNKNIVTGTNNIITALEDYAYFQTEECHISIYFRDSLINVTAFGDDSVVKKVQNLIESYMIDAHCSTVKWFYDTGSGIKSNYIPVKHNNVVKDIYYPFLKEGVHNFMQNYISSPEVILVLIGEPGTGKTSFIREFIIKNKFNASLTYEDSVISKDSFFVDFLMDDDQDLLIAEDADLLLSSREDFGNSAMAKILNAADGIVQMPKKKIIFSTNLTDIRKIDPALMRPGRCFAVVNFRSLTQEEADVVAKDNNITLDPNKKTYTLSDCFFNVKENAPIVKVGFR